jgi:hypothetical protein
MTNAAADIREMTSDEISDVSGGAVEPVTVFLAMLALYAAASKYWYDAGKAAAERDNRQDEIYKKENEKYRQGQQG